jgi:hypothetical protein
MMTTLRGKVASARVLKNTIVGVMTAFLGAAPSAQAQNGATPPYLSNFPNFAPGLTSPFPGDVDTALKAKLERAKQFDAVQWLFDLAAWQMFVALSWPIYDSGPPAQ